MVAISGRKTQNFIKYVCKLLVVGLIWAHFIWATYYFIDKTDYTLDETTCTGYGFLLILFIFINFGICYNLILGKHVVPLIGKFLWKPCVNILKKIKFGAIIFYVLVLVAILVFLIVDTGDDRQRLMPLCGLTVYMIFGFAISNNRRKISWHIVIRGLILQFILGLVMIRWETGRNIFTCVGDKVNSFQHYAQNGSTFAYGDFLVNDQAVFAFNALSVLYFMAFIINILYYYEIMQAIVSGLGKFLHWVLGTSICESVYSATNVFIGMSESPLLLKPYLNLMTEAEILSTMTSGFGTVSGTVLAAYISFGADPAHLITATVMSSPAALCFSKLIYPETQEIIVTKDKVKKIKMDFDSVLDAASKGASDASHIVIGIISNIIAFIAFVTFISSALSWMGELVGNGYVDESERWTVDLIMGKVFIPISYIMGVEWDECEKVGQLIGTKTMINEFVAFQKLGQMKLTPRSKIVATFAICGFANPGSIGIMLSSMGVLMPGKKEVLSRLVFRGFIGGCVSCFMTACIASMLTTV